MIPGLREPGADSIFDIKRILTGNKMKMMDSVEQVLINRDTSWNG